MPSFAVPQGLTQGAAAETGLGQYAQSVLNPLAAMTSWASSLATGQQTNVPTPGAFATQAGPAATEKGGKGRWATQFDPTTGLVTYTNTSNPEQTWTSDLSQARGQMQIDPAIINQWQNSANQYQQYQQRQQAGGGSATSATGAYSNASSSYLPQGVSLPSFQSWFGQNAGRTVFVNGQARTINTDLTADQALAAYQSGSLSWNAPAGPQLSQAYQDIQQQQAATGQMAGIEQQAQQFIDASTAESAKFGKLGDVQQQQAQGMISKADPMYAQAQEMISRADPMYQEAQRLEAQAGPMYNRAQTLENQSQQLYGKGYNELSAADKQIVEANALVKMTTTGAGLFPAQAAMIEQARQAEETQLASTLGGVGLGRSTQLDQLKGAADLASAATAGQLQQGNIQAAEQVVSGALGEQAGAQKTLGLSQTQQAAAQAQYEAAQKQIGLSQAEVTQAQQQVGLGQTEQQIAQKQVGLGITQEEVAQQSYQLQQAADKLTVTGQTLLASEQAQLTTQLQNITTQSLGFQKQLWDQAMSGYGVMGQMIDSSSKAYGMSLSAYTSVLDEMEKHTALQTQAQQEAQKADQQGTTDLFSALGSLFGQGSGGSSGGSSGGGGGGGGGSTGGVIGSIVGILGMFGI